MLDFLRMHDETRTFHNIKDERAIHYKQVDKFCCMEISNDSFIDGTNTDIAWNIRFNTLLEYEKKYFDCNVPFNYECIVDTPIVCKDFHDAYLLHSNEIESKEKIVKLGQWLHFQRQEKRKGKLHPARLRRLHELVEQGRLKWVMKCDSHDEIWNRNFEKLVEFGNLYGHCDVPFRYEYSDEHGSIRLGQWLATQRQKFKSKQLSDDRISKLQSLVNAQFMKWEVKPLADESWSGYFSGLLEYEKHYGSYNVPFHYSDESCKKLGRWLDKQRRLIRLNKLPSDRLELLCKLASSGDLRLETKEYIGETSITSMSNASVRVHADDLLGGGNDDVEDDVSRKRSHEYLYDSNYNGGRRRKVTGTQWKSVDLIQPQASSDIVGDTRFEERNDWEFVQFTKDKPEDSFELSETSYFEDHIHL